jgi:hypothetical protein
MLWVAGIYCSGVVAGVHAWRPAVWWIVAAVAFLCAAAYFLGIHPGFGWLLALATFFRAGALHIQFALICSLVPAS